MFSVIIILLSSFSRDSLSIKNTKIDYLQPSSFLCQRNMEVGRQMETERIMSEERRGTGARELEEKEKLSTM